MVVRPRLVRFSLALVSTLLGLQGFAPPSWSFVGVRRTIFRPRYVGIGCTSDSKNKLTLPPTQNAFPQSRWFRVSDFSNQDSVGAVAILPVIPSEIVQWPDTMVDIKVITPAHQRLYEDLLLSGKRQVFAPLSLPLDDESTTGINAQSKDLLMHNLGSVLWLEELRRVGDGTDGGPKYIASHKVIGRACLTKLLIPSTMFFSGSLLKKTDYMNAEVQFIEEEKEYSPTHTQLIDAQIEKCQQFQLIDALDEVRTTSETMGLPTMENRDIIKQYVNSHSSWEICALWSKPIVATGLHQGHAQSRDFWDPIVSLFSAENPRARRSLLLDLVLQEVQMLRARASLRTLLG